MTDPEQYVTPDTYMEGADTAIESVEAVVEILEGPVEKGIEHGLQAGFQPGSYVLEGFYTDHDIDHRNHAYYRRAATGASFAQFASVAAIGVFPLIGVAAALVDIPYTIVNASQAYDEPV